MLFKKYWIISFTITLVTASYKQFCGELTFPGHLSTQLYKAKEFKPFLPVTVEKKNIELFATQSLPCAEIFIAHNLFMTNEIIKDKNSEGGRLKLAHYSESNEFCFHTYSYTSNKNTKNKYQISIPFVDIKSPMNNAFSIVFLYETLAQQTTNFIYNVVNTYSENQLCYYPSDSNVMNLCKLIKINTLDQTKLIPISNRSAKYLPRQYRKGFETTTFFSVLMGQGLLYKFLNINNELKNTADLYAQMQVLQLPSNYFLKLTFMPFIKKMKIPSAAAFTTISISHFLENNIITEETIKSDLKKIWKPLSNKHKNMYL